MRNNISMHVIGRRRGCDKIYRKMVSLLAVVWLLCFGPGATALNNGKYSFTENLMISMLHFCYSFSLAGLGKLHFATV